MTDNEEYIKPLRYSQAEMERMAVFMLANPELMADFERRGEGLPVAVGPRHVNRPDLLGLTSSTVTFATDDDE